MGETTLLGLLPKGWKATHGEGHLKGCKNTMPTCHNFQRFHVAFLHQEPWILRGKGGSQTQQPLLPFPAIQIRTCFIAPFCKATDRHGTGIHSSQCWFRIIDTLLKLFPTETEKTSPFMDGMDACQFGPWREIQVSCEG